jgi:predicted kinase
MLEVIVFTGLQAAGKSTFYQQRFQETHGLVSKDLLRNNRRPERRQQQLIGEALTAGRPVVVDNTNPLPADRETIIAVARSFQARVAGYYFASPLAQCLVRNAARGGAARVPDRGLFATAKRLVPPAPNEGFDELWMVETLPGFRFAVSAYGEKRDET